MIKSTLKHLNPFTFRTPIKKESTLNLRRKLKRELSKKAKYQAKELHFGVNARNYLLKGSQIVANTSKISLGPKGRNAVLEVEYNTAPKITKDGVTIIKNIRHQDQRLEVGVALMREASHTTNEYCGDGTTTVSILANSILEKGMKMLDAGYNPIDIKRGMELARDEIIEFFEMMSEPLDTREKIMNAALVSTNYDEEISNVISDAIQMKGERGVIHIEPYLQEETSVVYIEGGGINRGAESEDFLKKETDMKVELKNPRVLVLDFKVMNLKDTTLMLDRLKKFKEPIVVLVKFISKECLSQILYNQTRDLLDIVVISFPGESRLASEKLEDFAAIFDSRVFDEFDSDEIIYIELEDMGKASKFEVGVDESLFLGVENKTKEHKERMRRRVRDIESLHNNAPSLSKVLYQNRLDSLSGNMTLIKLGGANKIEQQEIKDKLVDGLNSVKNGLKEGVIPGGGASLLHASKILDYLRTDNQDKNAGIEIMKQVCSEPVKILCENAGINGAYIAQRILEEYEDPHFGFNLLNEEFEDLMESGVYDSLYNAKNILHDAVSVGGMMLTCEVMIVRKNRYMPTPLKYYPQEMF